MGEYEIALPTGDICANWTHNVALKPVRHEKNTACNSSIMGAIDTAEPVEYFTITRATYVKGPTVQNSVGSIAGNPLNFAHWAEANQNPGRSANSVSPQVCQLVR
jgi:hypothetical protein